MNMTRIFILLFLVFICALGWVLGGMLSSNAFSMALGVIFGSMVGIPAMLIAVAKPQRHDHYHHVEVKDAQRQPQTMLAVKPTPACAIRVVNPALTMHNGKMIEVKR